MNRKGFLLGMLSLASFIYAEDAADDQELAYNNSKRGSMSRSSNVEQRLCELEKIFKKPKNFQPTNINDRGVVEVEGEFLYWKFFNKGMPIGIFSDERMTVSNLSPRPASNLQELFVKGHHKPGFRIGAGYTIPYGEWDLHTSWTRAHFFQKGPTVLPDGSTYGSQFYPYFQPVGINLYTPVFPSTTVPYALSSLKMQLRYDAVDLMLSRIFTLNSVFAFSPAIGIQADRIKQTQRVQAHGTTTDPDGGVATGTLVNDTRLRNHFSGVGIKGGTNLRMVLKYGVEVYGNIFMSILAGEYDVSYSTADRTNNWGDFTVYSKNTYKLPLTELDFSVGLKWGHNLYKQSYLDLHIGYEQRQLINFNKMQYFNVSPTANSNPALNHVFAGDLLLHGLVVGGKLFF